MPGKKLSMPAHKASEGVGRQVRPTKVTTETPPEAFERADVLIITPLIEEREALLKQLGRHAKPLPKNEDNHLFYQTTLRVGGKGTQGGTLQVVVVQPVSMARVKAATLTKDAVRRFRPRFVILVGIAGGVGEEVKLGDVLIADQIVDYEHQKLTDKGPSPRDVVFRVGQRLLQEAQHLNGWQRHIKVPRPEPGIVRAHFGPVACGDKVIAQRKALQSLLKHWPKLIGVEMEGSGVAAAVEDERPSPEYLMIRGVSDSADANKGKPEVERWRAYACATAAAFAARLLRDGRFFAAVAAQKDPGQSMDADGAAHPLGHTSDALRTSAASPQESLLAGLAPPSIIDRVRTFLANYLGTNTSPVPFGGREDVLANLDNWLTTDQSSPCLLLTAPAGRGKSALLAHWVVRLAGRRDVAVAYFPISGRFGTQQAQAILGALCGRLALLHGDASRQIASELTYSELRDLFTQLLRRRPAGRQLVLVVDGLDEAAGLDVDATLFPTPPEYLRIVVSAREGAEGRSERDYCYQLGWERGRVRLEHLSPLDRIDDIASILQSAGLPTNTLPARQRSLVLRELLKVGEGEPLLLRYLVEEIVARPEPLAGLHEYLKSLEPGFPGLMGRWWQQQKKSVEETALREYQSLIDVLAAGYGAMQRDDLLALLQDRLTGEQRLSRGLAALGRYVVEDSSQRGFVFSHSKLRDYFWDNLDKHAQEELDLRILRYGEKTVSELAQGTRKPDAVPRYVLHHLAAHQSRARQGVAQRMVLVSKAWHDAWAAAGSELGFLSDMTRVFDSVATVNQTAVAQGQSPPHLMEELRCALVVGTVRSRAQKISSELLDALLDRGIWSPAQALAHLRQAELQQAWGHDVDRLIAALKVLAPRLSRSLLPEAVELCLPIVRAEHSDRRPLNVLLPRMSEVDPSYVMAVLADLPDWHRVWLHIEAAKVAEPTARIGHLDEAEQTCDNLHQYPWMQISGYQDLVLTDPSRRAQILPKFLAATKQLSNVDHRITRLVEIRQVWPAAEFTDGLAECIAHIPKSGLNADALAHILFEANTIEDTLVSVLLRAMAAEEGAPEALYRMYTGGNITEQHRARMLRGVTESWSESNKRRLLQRAMTAVAHAAGPHGLDRVVTIILQLATDVEKRATLDDVNSLKQASTRAYGRALLAPLLLPNEHLPALRAVLASIEYDEWQRDCLVSLSRHMREADSAVACMIVLSDAHPALRRDLALHLAGQENAGEAARAVLLALVDHANSELREEEPEWKQRLGQSLALFSTDPTRAREMLTSAVQIGEEQDDPLRVSLALEYHLRATHDGGVGAMAKKALWHHLRLFYEKRSLRFSARMVTDELPALPVELRAEYVDFALSVARREHDVPLLLALRPHVRGIEPDSLLSEALSYARRLGDEYAQITLCTALADTADAQRHVLRFIQEQVKSPEERLPLLMSVLRPRALPEVLDELVSLAVNALRDLPPMRAGSVGWTATIAPFVEPPQRDDLITAAWRKSTELYLHAQAALAIPSDGLFANGTPNGIGEEIRVLAEGTPRLTQYLTEAQIRQALAWMPERPAFLWSRLRLAQGLPEPARTAHLESEFERACSLDTEDPLRPGSMARATAHLSAGTQDRALKLTLSALEHLSTNGDVHQSRAHCLELLAPVLRNEHADRIYVILAAASRSINALTSFPAILTAVQEPLRTQLGSRLFDFSGTLPIDLQTRLRAHLVAVVDPNRQELAIRAAVGRPEQSVLRALCSAVSRLSNQQLQWATDEVHKLHLKNIGTSELLDAAVALVMEQMRRGLPWQRIAYATVHATLHQRHRGRGDLLQCLTSQARLLAMLLRDSGSDAEQAIKLVQEVCGDWP